MCLIGAELSEQMNGKASVLSEAARFVKDMLSQIKHMRTENTTLLSESQYVSVLISGSFASLEMLPIFSLFNVL